MASQDTEITLGIGKLLGLFFALAALCAVFLGLGYSLGKNSVKTAAIADTSAPADPSAPKPSGSSSAHPATTAENKPDLSFYKSVEQKGPDDKLSAPDAQPAAEKPMADPTTPKGTAVAPEIARPGSGYLVQVAAVSKQEDAQALADALRKKSYAVQIATNPPNDRLYHVQVGPFTDIADAENIRNRLVSDGYNPILKK
ncbi:MAG TPA: SPOR domain-containing protein [Candidatus Koribacter sp.]|jgi:cell division protein FtsN